MATPVVNMPRAAGTEQPQDDGSLAQLRSKGLLPALGVGGAVYLVAGAVSMGTLALVGVGAGVGYGVGTWLHEQYEKRQGKTGGGAQDATPVEQLPPAYQVSLMQW